MMSVEEYALDVNKSVEEILKQCSLLNIDAYEADDMLDDLAITELDNAINNMDEEETEEENLNDVVVDNVKVTDNTLVTKQKLKKKDNKNTKPNNISKKELANKKKEMYKNKEKLQANTTTVSENVVLYKEGMSVAELANSLNVSGSELIKKLFSLGIMATLNNSITYENASLLAMD